MERMCSFIFLVEYVLYKFKANLGYWDTAVSSRPAWATYWELVSTTHNPDNKRTSIVPIIRITMIFLIIIANLLPQTSKQIILVSEKCKHILPTFVYFSLGSRQTLKVTYPHKGEQMAAVVSLKQSFHAHSVSLCWHILCAWTWH